MFLTALLFGVGAAVAQTTPPANPSPNPPANPGVKPGPGDTSAAPVPGANSFTERQVRSRLEARGYVDISGLAKDRDGIWRGQAVRDGKTVAVAVDYQGNVTGE